MHFEEQPNNHGYLELITVPSGKILEYHEKLVKTVGPSGLRRAVMAIDEDVYCTVR